MVQALLSQTRSSLILGLSQICCHLGMFVIAHLSVAPAGSPEVGPTVLYTFLPHPSEHRSFG